MSLDGFQVGEYMQVLEEWRPWRGHECCIPFPHAVLYGSLHLVPELYPFIINL